MVSYILRVYARERGRVRRRTLLAAFRESGTRRSPRRSRRPPPRRRPRGSPTPPAPAPPVPPPPAGPGRRFFPRGSSARVDADDGVRLRARARGGGGVTGRARREWTSTERSRVEEYVDKFETRNHTVVFWVRAVLARVPSIAPKGAPFLRSRPALPRAELPALVSGASTARDDRGRSSPRRGQPASLGARRAPPRASPPRLSRCGSRSARRAGQIFSRGARSRLLARFRLGGALLARPRVRAGGVLARDR